MNLRSVSLVFEPLYDAHLVKDVVQIPLGIADATDSHLRLVARPNAFQNKLITQLASCLHLIGRELEANTCLFSAQIEDRFRTRLSWYLLALSREALFSDAIVIYPWYASAILQAACFKLLRAILCQKKGQVILIRDGWKPSPKQLFQMRILAKVFAPYDVVFETPGDEPLESLVDPQNRWKSIPALTVRDESIHCSKKQRYSYIWIGRCDEPRKRLPDVVKAFAKIKLAQPEAQLSIIGACSSDTFKVCSIAELDPATRASIKFFGVISKAKVVGLLSLHEVYLAYPVSEGNSLSLYDAIYCGCAVITSRAGTSPFFLRGLDGLVDNIEQLVSVSLRLTETPELMRRQSVVLRARLDEFSLPAAITKASNCLGLQSIAKAGSPPCPT